MAQLIFDTVDNLPDLRTKLNSNFTEVYGDITSLEAAVAAFNPNLTVGDGLTTTGGLQVSLGTPSTLTGATTNATTATSHTHDISLTASDVGAASSAISITAGNGLTGGGTLAASRTLTLGTPGTLTSSTANSVSTTSHTHAVTFPTTLNAIGSYVIAYSSGHAVSTSYAAGSTQSGSLLHVSTSTASIVGGGLGSSNDRTSVQISAGTVTLSLSGTWRLMTRVYRGSNTDYYPLGLWVRIS